MVAPPENGDEGDRRVDEARREAGYIVEIRIGTEEHRHGGVERRQPIRSLEHRGNVGRHWVNVVLHAFSVSDSVLLFITGGTYSLQSPHLSLPATMADGGCRQDTKARDVIGADTESGP